MEEDSQRTEKLLAMILLQTMKDQQQADKALALSRAGFTNADIALLLGTSSAVITQQLYALRKAKKGKGPNREGLKRKADEKGTRH